jgi:hypothetical protein
MSRLLLLGALGLAACVRVEAGTDPEALGYGPGTPAAAHGYDEDPNPRPAPTPWTPPERTGALGLGQLMERATLDKSAEIERVCRHLASLSSERLDLSACYARYRVERVFRVITEWKTLAGCVEAAKDLDAVAACERATPRVFGPLAEYPRESATCMHLFALIITEEYGTEPVLSRDDLLEFEPLLRECVDSFVDERDGRTPAEYVAMLDCIDRAETTEAAEAC